MEKRQRVLLYGKSLILGTVGASLRQYPRLEIVSLTSPLPAAQELGALAPDVIIFDVEAAHPESALSLLETRPSLLLIGIGPSSDQMLLWSGRQSQALAMQDLVEIIQAQNGFQHPPQRAPFILERWGQSAKQQSAHLAERVLGHLPAKAKLPQRGIQLAGAAVGLVAVAAVVTLLAQSFPQMPLVGTAAADHIPPALPLVFIVGLVLGGVVIAVILRRRK